LLCSSRHQPALEEMHLRQLAEQRVDGVILAHDPYMPFPDSASVLKEAGIPYVALFNSPAAVSCDGVLLDEQAGVDQVLRYLVSLGHRRIAFCRPVPGDQPHPRENAYVEWMAQAGYPVPPHYVLPYEANDDAAGREALRMLFDQGPAPTAIFAGNDRMALLALKRLAQLQIETPRDVSVAGFDNLRFTEHLPVPLTTVDQPKQEMGRRAVELLLERIELNLPPEPRVEVFQPYLVIRDSCAIAPLSDNAVVARLKS
jgi:DNA-binding LacI/PurR family transcriptional regulator